MRKLIKILMVFVFCISLSFCTKEGDNDAMLKASDESLDQYSLKEANPECNQTILIYSTEAVENRDPVGNDLHVFDSIHFQLNRWGYEVDIHEKYYAGPITSTILENYGQLWVMGTNRDLAAPLSSDELDAIMDFVDCGGNLFIAAEHNNGIEDYTDDVNDLAANFGVAFSGSHYLGNYNSVVPDVVNANQLYENIDLVVAFSSEPDMTITNPDVEIAATYNGNILTAMLDGDSKIVFQRTWYTFHNYWIIGSPYNTFIHNVAQFLERERCNCSEESELIIDIKPGSDINPINLKSKGVIPVAILSTEDMDATSLAEADIRFGSAMATESHGKVHIEDVDNDGDDDLMLHFKTQETGITSNDVEACITCTLDGQTWTGCDIITIVN